MRRSPAHKRATQSQMETATAQSVYVTPGLMKNHPGVAKAWVYFTTSGGTGVGGTVTIAASHNVASVTKTAAGIFKVIWVTPNSSANYGVVGTCSREVDGTFGAIVSTLASAGALFASGVSVATTDHAGIQMNPKRCTVVRYGDFA